MDQFTVDYGKLAYLDIPKWKQPAGPPPRRQFGPFERPAVELAIDNAARLSTIGRILQQIKDLGKSAAAIPVRFKGLRGPMIKAPPTGLSVLTIGAGVSTAAFAGLGVTVGTGLYGSNTPEFGAYASGGGGYWTNVGASGGIQYTVVFGPPSSFAGVCWGVGVDIGVPGTIVGAGAMALFGMSGPPFEFLGVSWSVAVGPSILPADVTIQFSETKIFPINL